MNQEFTIRPRERSDDPRWARLRQALWPDCAEDMHLSEMKEYDTHADTMIVFLAEHQSGEIIGFAEASIRPRVDGSLSVQVGYLEGWYVDPRFRRTGVGRALVRRVEDWARSHGLSELASDTELNNEASQKSHAALGFRETFRLVHFLKSLDDTPESKGSQ